MNSTTFYHKQIQNLLCLSVLQALFRRAQLKALVDAHGLKEGLGGNLSHDEITVIQGALDLTHKTAGDCMTPMDKVSLLL